MMEDEEEEEEDEEDEEDDEDEDEEDEDEAGGSRAAVRPHRDQEHVGGLGPGVARDTGVHQPLPLPPSRRRDCHSADALSPSLLKHPLKVEGGAAE